jgi:hypothetical protein
MTFSFSAAIVFASRKICKTSIPPPKTASFEKNRRRFI